jgi:ATP-binding cassette subfamily B protein/subfamily B ATP-binding cassette protein MsbA
MKNFLRALRIASDYRGRLILSLACAVFGAALWGLMFTCIDPVLYILKNAGKPDNNLQARQETKIADAKKKVEELGPQIQTLADEDKQLADLPPSAFRDKRRAEVARSLDKLTRRLETARNDLRWLHFSKRYIDRFLPTDAYMTVVWLLAFVVASVALRGVFDFSQESLVGSVVNRSLYDLRNRFFRNVIHLDVSQFGEQGTGEMMARFTNDTELVGQGMKTIFGRVVSEPLKALSCVVFACWISWQLTLMFLILVPVALFILTKVGRMMKRATRRLLERMSSIYKILQDVFLGIRVVKAFTREAYERRRFRAITKDYCQKALMVVKLDALSDPLIELLGVAAVALALMAGAYLVLEKAAEERLPPFGLRMSNHPLEPEELLALYAYLMAIADPVRKLSSVYTRIQSGFAASDRIFDFMDRRPRIRANSDGRRLGTIREGIEFRDICFSYDPDNPILTNVHLHVRAGETVALVGKNGCGKTTLLGLLPRFYDPDHGAVLIDGLDVRKLSLRSLRKQIGVVTQDAILFEGTIRDNIAYSNRRATQEQVEEAARLANAHEFIAGLRQGYQTQIGEARGLSGGQKQRIALARALLRDPQVLILDEFTSAADAESEAAIHRALREFKRDRTTFVITHRLNTLEIADRIVVMDDKRIVAVGTHAELVATCPLYQRLHEAQAQKLVA